MTKTCTKCKEEKSREDFSKKAASKDGRRNNCKSCDCIESRIRYENNREKRITQAKAWRENNRERVAALTKAWCAANKGKVSEGKKAWNAANRERKATTAKAWSKANRGRKNATNAKRKAAKLERTPPWLTKEDYQCIAAIYVEAARRTKETGIPYEVDHIIPLQGQTVSGLHVPSNLQILTKSENCRKSNSF